MRRPVFSRRLLRTDSNATASDCRITSRFVVPSVLVWLASCSAAEPYAARQFEYSRWVARPVVVYGASDTSSTIFGSVLGVARAPDGSVLVLDGKEAHVVELHGDGSIRRHYGRRGQGPGELMRPYQVGTIGDSIWVADLQLRRITIFLRGSVEALVHSLDMIEGVESASWMPEALLRDGSLLVLSPPVGNVRTGVRSLIRMKDGGRSDTVTTVEPFEMWEFTGDDGNVRRRYHPLQFRDVYTFSRSGETIAVIGVRSQAESAASLIEVRHLSVSTGRSWSRSIPHQPLRVDARLLDSLVDTLLARESKDTRVRARTVLIAPSTVPPVRGAMAATDGGIWFGRADWQGNEWLHVPDQSAPIRRVQFPDGFLPFDAVGDSVWGMHRDPQFGSTVAVLVLERTTSPPAKQKEAP